MPVVEAGWPTGPCAIVVGCVVVVGVVDVVDINIGVDVDVDGNASENELATRLVVGDEEV